MATVARRFWCDVLGIPVYDAQYFAGVLVHEEIRSPARAALVAFAPLTINTLLCAILFFPVGFSIVLETETLDPVVFGILAWAGLSIGMHALPSRVEVNGYLDNLAEENRRGWTFSFLRVTGFIFIVVDFLKPVWIDLIYALAVGVAAPWFAIWLTNFFYD
ncbi:hypothetical protein [Variovorax sp. J22R115]|uniref:hypothetical protein n=1 Tax=Variovorax sp. J22R115 TaxID=3053509 RepID=UPI002575AA7B|nr:hypothetical protein [Variovorax sp. J22R115]MDM0053810.1 hypothetical protein [Variovorax sp. J22R115]